MARTGYKELVQGILLLYDLFLYSLSGPKAIPV